MSFPEPRVDPQVRTGRMASCGEPPTPRLRRSAAPRGVASPETRGAPKKGLRGPGQMTKARFGLPHKPAHPSCFATFYRGSWLQIDARCPCPAPSPPPHAPWLKAAEAREGGHESAPSAWLPHLALNRRANPSIRAALFLFNEFGKEWLYRVTCVAFKTWSIQKRQSMGSFVFWWFACGFLEL